MNKTAKAAADLADLLEPMSGEIVDEAVDALRTAHYAHYESWGETLTHRSMTDLFEHLMMSLRDHDLVSVIRHCEQMAKQRFTSGFRLVEVQSAFNALEQTVWQRLVEGVPAERATHYLGLLGAVLGAGKDAASCTYVHLAAHHHAPALNVELLADGTV